MIKSMSRVPRYSRRCNGRPARRFGVTIIELMVSFGVILVLMSILVPALRGARQRAEEIGVLSQARQNGIIIAIYIASHQGFFPLGRYIHPSSASALWSGEAVRSGVLSQHEAEQLGSGWYHESIVTALEARHMYRGQTLPWESLKVDRIRASKIANPSGLALLSYSRPYEIGRASCRERV